MTTQSADSALLSVDQGVLYNNVFGKGGITNARQAVFSDGTRFGWEWDWPEGTGTRIKSYPEIILGHSPWSPAKFGNQLPCALAEAHFIVDFDQASTATGAWAESLDFWISDKPDPTPQDITCNLCIWNHAHQLEGAYRGRRESLRIGDRSYSATFETPADQPAKTWNTLFVADEQARSRGSIDLRPFLDLLVQRGLAKVHHLLSTAELGTEIAFGTGKTLVNEFRLRQA